MCDAKGQKPPLLADHSFWGMTVTQFLGALGEASIFSPSMAAESRQALLAGWRRAVSTTLAWSRWEGEG